MNKQSWMILAVTVALVAGGAGILFRLGVNQKLGRPGVRTLATKDPKRLEVVLPEKVLDYKSERLEVDEMTLNTLPADTSFGQRKYEAPDGFLTVLNVVLMGRDRTSMHKPQFCLTGQGWTIQESASAEDRIRIEGPAPYDLPVVKLISTRRIEQGGQVQVVRGVFVYWYVADNAVSASVSGMERMWWMGVHLLRTGVLQRWAYVTCFSWCLPGQEEATYERMKKFIAASVPEFQNPPQPTWSAAR